MACGRVNESHCIQPSDNIGIYLGNFQLYNTQPDRNPRGATVRKKNVGIPKTIKN